MANITDVQAVKFCNEKARVLADLLAQMYETCRRFNEEWSANNITSLVPNDSSPIIDGATVTSGTADGRKPIKGSDVNGLHDRAFELVSLLEANSSAKLVQIQAISVNGQAKY